MVDPPAIRCKNFIDGTWLEADEWQTTTNPATGECLALVPKSSRETARLAIAAASRAQRDWAALSVWERAKFLMKMAVQMQRRRRDLASVVTTEQGKPLSEALDEVDAASDGFQLAAELGKELCGQTIPTKDVGKIVFTIRQARGVYAVITPWNFPLMIPAEYLGPALVTGNTVVWLPAWSTSQCATELMKCAEEAALPYGVVNLVMGSGAVVGDELVRNPQTNAIGFTGSTITGQKIAVRSGGKPCLLELGGNGPIVVFEDADIGEAAAAAGAACFRNAGQSCAAAGRILVHRDVAQPFADLLVEVAKRMVVGDPRDPRTTMGPLHTKSALDKVEAHVDEAIAKGAVALTGARRLTELGRGNYYAPTVLTSVTRDMLVNREETFGPVAPLIAFDNDDGAVSLTCDNDYGLTCGVFTSDLARALRFAIAIPTGIVNINAGTSYWESHLPFGGGSGKKSGIGRIGGRFALEAMTEVKSISIQLG